MKFLNLQRHVIRSDKILVRYNVLRMRMTVFYYRRIIFKRGGAGTFMSYLMQLEAGTLSSTKGTFIVLRMMLVPVRMLP